MSNAPDPEVPVQIREAAERLERHIRACGLKPGDRYITTEEAGRLLGRSVLLAQQAMAYLARRGVLERRPRAGTFIGPAMEVPVEVMNIHYLLPDEASLKVEDGGQYWGHVNGIRSVLGKVSVHFHFIPNQDVDYARQIIQPASQAGLLNGVVLVLPSRAMRAYFDRSGIPTVVAGGVEPDLTRLCWIQWDQRQVGYLLAAHLLEQGHRRLVTIMRDLWSMGEPLLHEGIHQALSEHGLFSNAIRMRSLPNEASAIAETVRNLLREDDPPTGFICRNEFQARQTAAVVKSLGGDWAERIDIVQCNAPSQPEHAVFPYAMPHQAPAEMGAMIGRFFEALFKQEIPEPRGYEIPVELRRISREASWRFQPYDL